MKKPIITKLSKKGFSFLIISAIVGGAILSVLFMNLEKLNTKTVKSKEIHKSFLDVKNATRKLLTSSHLRDSIEELNKFVIIFNQKLNLCDRDEKAKIEADWSICLDELKQINERVNHHYFDNKFLKSRPLLRIEGELFHLSSSTELYHEISTLIDSIEYLLQYEAFIITHYETQNIQNDLMQKAQVEKIKDYATIVAILFLLFLLSISFYTVRAISKNELALISATQELEDGLQELENARRFIKNIIDNTPVRVFWKDINSVYLGANKLFLEDMQLEDEKQLIGTSDWDHAWSDLAQSYIDDDKKVMSSKKAKIKFEEDVHLDNGTIINVVSSKIPLLDEENNVIGVLGIYDDVTEQKKLQADVVKKENMLVEQSRLAQMGEMISMIAHQWRQPLGAISSTSVNLKMKIELESFDLESKKGVDEASQYFLERLDNINSYVQNLTTTVDDFRNFYKPNKQSVIIKLEEVISKSLNIIKASLLNDNIEIIEEYNHKEEIELYDSEMMQVILNVLRNAQDNFKEKDIKKPFIKITVDNRKIIICDNGGGIREDIIDRIFDPYFSTKDEKNGTGLGLYMSKTIVEDHHNGNLNVTSIDDETCFIIELGEINH